MEISSIISIVSLIVSGIIGYVAWNLHKKIIKLTNAVGNKFSEFDIEKRLSGSFNGENNKLDDVTRTIFYKLKKKFQLNANSYFQILDEIKNTPQIDKNMKELLINFFNQIINISYRDAEVPLEKEEELKQKTKVIINFLQK
ncbi:MAG: hypothetical protein ACQESC_01360 [Nanobdellota archaeon]